ncbi:MAG: hypothetical protein JF625_27495 [Inquilinus limosus]|uniref:Uncharacterized protein n=1 Tax=Inquilinus limosus TaxID=171674 RepID=A0A952FUJ8_9PROT|nr:hypothetical protein [Inquilinus limosus]
MRIDFLGLGAFLTIANWGGFHRAAGHPNLSQTAPNRRPMTYGEACQRLFPDAVEVLG